MPNPPDPRQYPDFNPLHFPLCDGRPAPTPDPTNWIHERILEFATAYYHLNRNYDRLRKVRIGESKETPEAVLKDIEAAAFCRDTLEDRLAPEGFYAEPIIDGIITVDLVFSHALKKRIEIDIPPVESSFSLFVPMPPPGTDLKEHLRRHLSGLFELDSPLPEAPSSTGRSPANIESPPAKIVPAERKSRTRKSPSKRAE